LNQYFSRLFSRPTHNFKPIDGVRAIAVIWVIIFHAWLFQYNDFQTVGDGIFDSPFLIARFKNKLIPFSLLALITIGLTYHYSFNILKFEVPFNSVFLDDAWEDWFWDYYMLTHLRYGGLLSGVVGAYLFVYHSEQLASFFTKNKRLINVLFLGSIAVFVLISSIALGQWTILQSSIFDGMDPSIL
jgi:peptidoglycan/LPS O-acetylase OafA/YrhL